MIERPQLPQMILHRRSRQAKPRRRLQPARRHRIARPRILDVLRLVQHHRMKFHPPEHRLVTHQNRIGRNHQIRLPQSFPRIRPPRPVMHRHRQRRTELPRLTPPVRNQTRRTHNQRRPSLRRPGLLIRQQQRQRLQGLPQSHVVRQHAAKAVLRQKPQPPPARYLIRPQLRLQPRRQLRLVLPSLPQPRRQPPQPLRRHPEHHIVIVRHRSHRRRPQSVHRHPPALQLLRPSRNQFRQAAQNPVQPTRRHRHQPATLIHRHQHRLFPHRR